MTETPNLTTIGNQREAIDTAVRVALESVPVVAYRRVLHRSNGAPYFGYTESRLYESDVALCVALNQAASKPAPQDTIALPRATVQAALDTLKEIIICDRYGYNKHMGWVRCVPMSLTESIAALEAALAAQGDKP